VYNVCTTVRGGLPCMFVLLLLFYRVSVVEFTTFGFCLAELFFRMLGWVPYWYPEGEYLRFAGERCCCRPDVLPVTQPTGRSIE